MKEKIPRITVQELKKKMDEKEPVFIVDVRRQRDENRIPGAVLHDPDAILEADKFELHVRRRGPSSHTERDTRSIPVPGWHGNSSSSVTETSRPSSGGTRPGKRKAIPLKKRGFDMSRRAFIRLEKRNYLGREMPVFSRLFYTL